ncbi:MAG: hypothetical protein ACT4PZ_05270 [Panacagrimonas sp.]
MKKFPLFSATLGAVLAMSWVADASAAEIRVRCEKRATRSKVSVDGGNFAPGVYTARISSGGKTRTSPPTSTVGDELEFDFDSAVNDIGAGATAIPRDYIQNATVRAKIVNTAGRTVISDTEDCRVR